jgi:hypothetical protein
MISRRAFTGGLLAATALGASGARGATTADGRRRINLAARQGMLTQQIAKSACFAALGVTPEAQAAFMKGSSALFERTLAALRHGDRNFGLVAESKTQVLIALSDAERHWTDFRPAVEALADAPSIAPGDLGDVIALNLPVLDAALAHAQKVERAYGGNELPLHLAVAINFAGRQRMLTQKMAKEYALVALGIEAEANRASLGETIGLFDASLTALSDGFPPLSLQAPKNPALREKLAIVRGLWTEVKPAFARTAEGATPTAEELPEIAWLVNPILVQMNRAVFLFEEEA